MASGGTAKVPVELEVVGGPYENVKLQSGP
jgi:hypothetical protein